jgi:hypothetical protein
MGSTLMAAAPQLHLLPPRSRELANLIGIPALLELSRWRGGTTIYVPSKKRLRRSHPIVGAIGWEAALSLADEEGRRVEVPMLKQGASSIRHARIRAYRATHSLSETARHFGITDRWVRHLMTIPE